MAMGLKTVRLSALMMSGSLQKRAKGQIIQTTEGEKFFYLVKSGYIKRYFINKNGTLGIQVIYGPGNFFSISQIYKLLFERDINDGPEVFFYEAMCPVVVYTQPIEAVIQRAKEDPMLYRDFLLVSGNRLRSTLRGMENKALPSAYSKVAHQLVHFAKTFGEKDQGNKVTIRIPLTHQDIGDSIGLTRETVSNAIGQLKKKNLIKANRHMVITDLATLEKEAYS